MDETAPEKKRKLTKADVVSFVGDARYRRACELHVRRSSEWNPLADWNSDEAELPHEIAFFILDNEDDPNVQLDLLIAVCNEMPTYALAMYFGWPLTEVAPPILEWVRRNLDSDRAEFRNVAGYQLQMGLFESSASAEDLESLIDPWPSERALKEILGRSGAAAWGFKRRIFERIIDDKRWHPEILASLYQSVYDGYGQIDGEEGAAILKRLDLPADTPHLSKLSEMETLENIHRRQWRKTWSEEK